MSPAPSPRPRVSLVAFSHQWVLYDGTEPYTRPLCAGRHMGPTATIPLAEVWAMLTVAPRRFRKNWECEAGVRLNLCKGCAAMYGGDVVDLITVRPTAGAAR